MDQKPNGFPAEKRSDNDNRKRKTADTPKEVTPTTPREQTFGERWGAMRPSKTLLASLCLGMIIGTMLVGFTWGGWVTKGTSQKAAVTMSNDAVIQRLSSICVAQFQQDPAKDEMLIELQAASSYEQRNFVRDQGWSIMPGDEESDSEVASACAKVLAQLE